MSASLDELLDEVTAGLPGCLHTSVVAADTGLSLAGASVDDSINAAGADAYHSDLYRLAGSVLEALPADQKRPAEIVLSSGRARFVSRPLNDGGYIWLVVTEADTTVGLIQAMMRKHVDRLQEALAGLMV